MTLSAVTGLTIMGVKEKTSPSAVTIIPFSIIKLLAKDYAIIYLMMDITIYDVVYDSTKVMPVSLGTKRSVYRLIIFQSVSFGSIIIWLRETFKQLVTFSILDEGRNIETSRTTLA
jgi:hypothetical protein